MSILKKCDRNLEFSWQHQSRCDCCFHPIADTIRIWVSVVSRKIIKSWILPKNRSRSTYFSRYAIARATRPASGFIPSQLSASCGLSRALTSLRPPLVLPSLRFATANSPKYERNFQNQRKILPSLSHPWPCAAIGYAGSPWYAISMPRTSTSASTLNTRSFQSKKKRGMLQAIVQERMARIPTSCQANWWNGVWRQSPSFQPEWRGRFPSLASPAKDVV